MKLFNYISYRIQWSVFITFYISFYILCVWCEKRNLYIFRYEFYFLLRLGFFYSLMRCMMFSFCTVWYNIIYFLELCLELNSKLIQNHLNKANNREQKNGMKFACIKIKCNFFNRKKKMMISFVSSFYFLFVLSNSNYPVNNLLAY